MSDLSDRAKAGISDPRTETEAESAEIGPNQNAVPPLIPRGSGLHHFVVAELTSKS